MKLSIYILNNIPNENCVNVYCILIIVVNIDNMHYVIRVPSKDTFVKDYWKIKTFYKIYNGVNLV